MELHYPASVRAFLRVPLRKQAGIWDQQPRGGLRLYRDKQLRYPARAREGLGSGGYCR